MPELGEQSVLPHRPDQIIAGEDDVPSGISGERLGQHLLIALIDAVPHAYAELALEIGDGIRSNVVRPVVDVEARTPVERAAGESREPEEEMAARHCFLSRRRSESRMSAPKNTTIS